MKDFYGHYILTADSRKAVASYRRKYGHLVLIDRLESMSTSVRLLGHVCY